MIILAVCLVARMQGEMTELLGNLEILTNFMSLFKIDDDKTIKDLSL